MSLGELERKCLPSLLLGMENIFKIHFLSHTKLSTNAHHLFFFLHDVQECGIGFYRENKGLFAGRCVPCNCNGNSNRCQDGTGECIVSNK